MSGRQLSGSLTLCALTASAGDAHSDEVAMGPARIRLVDALHDVHMTIRCFSTTVTAICWMAVRSGRALGSSGPPELWANLSNFKF